jgi:AcrR family transcriptional regulator
VARGVILAHGPAVSTALIAEHAGVSQATLFKRFGTKEALVVRALAAPECMAFVDVLAAGPDARPIPEQLAAAGAEILAFYTRMVPAVQALFAAGVRPDCAFAGEVPPPLRVRAALLGFFGAAQAAGRVRPGDPEPLVYAFMGALHGRVFLRHFLSGPAPAEPADDARFVAGLVDALWAGLAPGGR